VLVGLRQDYRPNHTLNGVLDNLVVAQVPDLCVDDGIDHCFGKTWSVACHVPWRVAEIRRHHDSDLRDELPLAADRVAPPVSEHVAHVAPAAIRANHAPGTDVGKTLAKVLVDSGDAGVQAERRVFTFPSCSVLEKCRVVVELAVWCVLTIGKLPKRSAIRIGAQPVDQVDLWARL
jgi:hypothetical protein